MVQRNSIVSHRCCMLCYSNQWTLSVLDFRFVLAFQKTNYGLLLHMFWFRLDFSALCTFCLFIHRLPMTATLSPITWVSMPPSDHGTICTRFANVAAAGLSWCLIWCWITARRRIHGFNNCKLVSCRAKIISSRDMDRMKSGLPRSALNHLLNLFYEIIHPVLAVQLSNQMLATSFFLWHYPGSACSQCSFAHTHPFVAFKLGRSSSRVDNLPFRFGRFGLVQRGCLLGVCAYFAGLGGAWI